MKIDRVLLATATAAMAMLVLGACGGDGGDAGGSVTATTTGTIPQPPLDKLNRITRRRLAPNSERVDLRAPSFSDPTEVTNPLFPISRLNAVIIGEVEGKPLKIETTLLPQTKTVEWDGRRIEALQSQFLAYLEGRITESAIDLYAQADDGAVWYFGEDVVDYEKGVAATTEGTWVVGVDGPAAMIMPAHPKVGEVYRTENIPGVAFEQVTVKTVGKTVQGPTGPVKGAMVGVELHQDETKLEPKTFAPGYGEFFSGSAHDFEANALSVPADAAPGPPPAALTTLTRSADDVFEAARSERWVEAAAALRTMTGAWRRFRAGEVPRRLGARLNVALAGLAGAVGARDRRKAPQAALDVAEAGLDLELRYRRPGAINVARFELWAGRLLADAEAHDAAGIKGDVTTLEFIRDRVELGNGDGHRIDDKLRYLRAVAAAGEFGVARDEAARLRGNLLHASSK
jgi:hypothetical protein